jgi:hypothetical protein
VIVFGKAVTNGLNPLSDILARFPMGKWVPIT